MKLLWRLNADLNETKSNLLYNMETRIGLVNTVRAYRKDLPNVTQIHRGRKVG